MKGSRIKYASNINVVTYLKGEEINKNNFLKSSTLLAFALVVIVFIGCGNNEHPTEHPK